MIELLLFGTLHWLGHCRARTGDLSQRLSTGWAVDALKKNNWYRCWLRTNTFLFLWPEQCWNAYVIWLRYPNNHSIKCAITKLVIVSPSVGAFRWPFWGVCACAWLTSPLLKHPAYLEEVLCLKVRNILHGTRADLKGWHWNRRFMHQQPENIVRPFSPQCQCWLRPKRFLLVCYHQRIHQKLENHMHPFSPPFIPVPSADKHIRVGVISSLLKLPSYRVTLPTWVALPTSVKWIQFELFGV